MKTLSAASRRPVSRFALVAASVPWVAVSHAQTANDAVLQQWATQTGQSAQVVQTEQGSQLEWHGQASIDVYSNSVSTPGGNASLSPLREGTFERVTVGNDLRSTGAQGDVNYLQAVGTQSNDRSVLSRYNPQMFSFQAGRAGPGYQIAAGDVVASHSTLGANMGLRGFSAARQIDALTVSGFAGTVAESWESLFNARPLNQQPARLTFLRDVYGAKADYQLSRQTSVFGTVQSRQDRRSSLVGLPGAVAPPSQAALAATAGIRYQTNWAPDQTLVVTGEIGRSRQKELATRESASDEALLLDAQGRYGAFGLRAGFHDLGDRWASVGQSAAPGIREAYAGGDWQLGPAWSWGTDVRRTESNQLFGAAAFHSTLDSLSNRLTWTPEALTGWSFSVSDLRNRMLDATNARGENDSVQFSVSRSVAPWVASLTLGRSALRTEGRAASDSRTNQWQFTAGRSWSDATAETPASLTFNLQGLVGVQSQMMALPASNRALTAGLFGSLLHARWGSVNFNLQMQSIDPENGSPKLRTTQWSLDYTRQLSDQWTVKGFWRDIDRNQGSLIAQVRERVLGIQLGYLW